MSDEKVVRVVFDTTVLIDGLFQPQSASAKVLKQVKYGRLQLITSASILGEFQSVAQNLRFHQTDVRAWLLATGIASLDNVTVVRPTDIPATVPGDPMDDHVIAAAVTGKVDYIVATDHHLLDLKNYKGIPIVTPDEFLVLVGVNKPGPAKPAVEPPDMGGLAA